MKMTSCQKNSVGYLKTESIQDDHPSDIVDGDQVHFSLDPNLQTILAQMSQKSGCWGKFFPIPFERASQKSWWDPTFDSEILEDQYKNSAFPHYRFKFRYTLWYAIAVSICWIIYILCHGLVTELDILNAKNFLFVVLLLYNIFVLLITYTKIFQRHITIISLGYALSSLALSFTFLILAKQIRIGHFCACIQLLLQIYALIPLKLYMGLTLAILYSVCFELSAAYILSPTVESSEAVWLIFTRILSHIAIHLIGLHIYLMNNVRMRQTFMKVGQSLLVRKQLELEKRLKENMIHSLMPPSVASWLLNEDDPLARRSSRKTANNDLRYLFRPFNMDTMNNVSILFADIVGFTKMSSNKSAEELVEILNNLFQRFDDLCKDHSCEKISTLGDCYYCVSGCPKPRPDHAHCCVEMGLSMIQAIKKFDQEKHEGINIRVGIHTGTVLCGIVGTKRFKFDVWSNDVTLANKMESTGKPGMVHISEQTKGFLNDQYLLEDGQCISGLNTYFILGRRTDNCPSYQGSIRSEGRQKYANSLQLFISPPASTASLSPDSRKRGASCDTSHLKSSQNKNFLSPDSCIMKANSLPSILDSDNDQDPPDGTIIENVKTPTSTASSGKYSIKPKTWKIPSFMKKNSTSSSKPDIDIDFVSGTTDASEEGYQQIPTIIESNLLNGKTKDSFTTLTSKYEDYPLYKDTIDIKSYISHSRSDIGAFEFSPMPEFVRGGSYRSQVGGRSFNGDFSSSNRFRRGYSPNLDGLEPIERARSATVTAANISRPKRPLDGPSKLAMFDEYSGHSRKDSGIRSNSRRSSIEQIDNTLLNQEMLQHRVSGYYTSSQTSMNSARVNPGSHGPFFDKFGTCIQNLRKQSDRQLIKCVQDNSRSKCSYFIQRPLSPWTLFFEDKVMEKDYRAKVHHIQTNVQINTLANSRFNTYVDIFVSVIVFIIVSSGLVFVYGVTTVWLVSVFICLLLQFLNLGLCVIPVVRWTDRLCWCSSRFYRWNVFGAVLVSLPMLSAIVNFAPDLNITYFHMHMFTYPLFVGLVHFCNFTQLNCWMKSSIATGFCVIFSFIFIMNQCTYTELLFSNITNTGNGPPLLMANQSYNRTLSKASVTTPYNCYFQNGDLIIHLLTLVILVWLLNREFEIGYRLSFHANYVAKWEKDQVQSLKDLADQLIYNIVPKHVAEQLKKEAKYSENFKDVGIIFASIVNFNEMYEETFEGGKEYLRVLNELIADFDELLYREEFQCVEKIKTIGSTFMAASGLNSQMRAKQKDPYEHLYTLMDFAMEMQNVVENFNGDLLEFNLIIRIGYNLGEVTAAVIGNTKLYYDIWGDAVNIASRMDSTGINGRIQVGEHCLPVLENKFEFDPRGPVYVKGKDNMNVYLLKGRKDKNCGKQNNISNNSDIPSITI